MNTVHQAYHLQIRRSKGLDKAFSVISFEGTESLGEASYFKIRVSHPQADLDRASFLNKPAVFTMSPNEERKVQGMVTQLNKISSSADETIYELVLESKLALLGQCDWGLMNDTDTDKEFLTKSESPDESEEN